MTNIAPPATTWQGSQDQEYTQTGNPDLLTEDGKALITEDSKNIVLEDLAVVRLPATTWSENDST